jgi:methionine-R-sulfoxide reductase
MGGKEMEATRRRQRQEAEHADPGPQSTMRLQESQSAPDFSVADRNLTFGSRITPAERSVLRQYAGIIFAVLLICGAIYLFLVAQKEKRETTGFDPNRPVPSDTVLRRRLTPEEYSVVREHGSQMPFRNEYWNTQRTGIYVDVITGQPLFTSLDKYDSNLGIPSFSKPIAQDLLVERPDNSEDMQRTEVLAKRSNAHLGYLFSDPQSPTGRRYSIYSAALHFIPKAEMKDKAYEAYLPILEKK